MAGKHGSKAPRNKKYVERPIKKAAAFDAIRKNWRTVFQAANVDESKVAELRVRFGEQVGVQEQDNLRQEYATAFTALVIGTGDEKDWTKVVTALNTGMVLCERGIGFEHLDAMISAQDQVYAPKLHFDKTGEWIWTDAARDAINAGLDIHAAQLEHPKVMQADVLSAVADIHRRIEEQQVYKEAA